MFKHKGRYVPKYLRKKETQFPLDLREIFPKIHHCLYITVGDDVSDEIGKGISDEVGNGVSDDISNGIRLRRIAPLGFRSMQIEAAHALPSCKQKY